MGGAVGPQCGHAVSSWDFFEGFSRGRRLVEVPDAVQLGRHEQKMNEPAQRVRSILAFGLWNEGWTTSEPVLPERSLRGGGALEGPYRYRKQVPVFLAKLGSELLR